MNFLQEIFVQTAGNNPVLQGLVGGVAGALVLDRADAWVPHVHVLITGRVRDDEAHDSASGSIFQHMRVASVILFIVAITLRSGNLGNAIPLMLATGIQNVPKVSRSPLRP